MIAMEQFGHRRSVMPLSVATSVFAGPSSNTIKWPSIPGHEGVVPGFL